MHCTYEDCGLSASWRLQPPAEWFEGPDTSLSEFLTETPCFCEEHAEGIVDSGELHGSLLSHMS